MPIGHSNQQLREKVAKLLKIKENQIKKFQIAKKSIDARKKPELYIVYSVDVAVDNENGIFKKVNNNNIMLTKIKNSAKQELYNEISKIRKSASKKVKPGYKKKIEKEVERAKSRYRREIIKKDIRKQREERYKKETRNAR